MTTNTLKNTSFHRSPSGLTLRFSFIVPLALISIVVMPHLAQAGAGRIVAGADVAAGGHVKAFTCRSLSNTASFFSYTPTFNGGVRVAAGDVNGDGAPDIITGSGPGAAHVKVFSGRNQGELHSFLPYGAGFSGGVFVAAGDVNDDGLDDIVTGADASGPANVKVFDGATGAEILSLLAYPANFNGGVRVAVGDVNGDGRADIITGAGPGATSHVKVFDGVSQAEISSFFAYDVGFTGGVFVAAGDINGDGYAEVVTGSGPGARPYIKVFDGRTGGLMQSFFPYETGFSGGVRVAVGDVDGDGRSEIMTVPGNGAVSQVQVFDGQNFKETASFLAYPSNYTEGAFIAAASVKQPRLLIQADRENAGMIQLQWPAGCVCELQVNLDATSREGWTALDVRPVETGNRIGLLLPAVQKFQSFRLKLDIEAIR